MNASSQTQLSAATALVQLLTEHPDLSEFITWSISRTRPKLVGYVQGGGGLTILAACAKYLGAEVESSHVYESGDHRMRQYVVEVVWRDVPVEVMVSLPVAAEAVAA